MCETLRPDPPPPDELPPTNIGGGPCFTCVIGIAFERIYLEHFPPVYKLEEDENRFYKGEENENGADEDKYDDKIHTQLDSTLTPLDKARAYYQELIGMEL